MIAVSALTGYLYCPRKFYLQYVIRLSEPAKKPTIEGTILHAAADNMQDGINKATYAVTEATTLKELEMGYKKAFYLSLFNSINANEANLKTLGIDKLALFKELWEQMSADAAKKACFIFSLANTHKAYGTALLDMVKASTEVRLESQALGIRGIADRIEERNGKITVCEMKTGTAPKEGMWPGHRIQLAAYMMILKEKENKDIGGVLEYGSDCRKMALNPFIEDEVKNLISTVTEARTSRKVPDKTESKNKCRNCGLKKYCDHFPQ